MKYLRPTLAIPLPMVAEPPMVAATFDNNCGHHPVQVAEARCRRWQAARSDGRYKLWDNIDSGDGWW